jgi:hypothetical protein
MRTLRKEEISVKPKQVVNGRVLLLLYKDARVDMDMLDEEFGSMNWKRSHKEVAGNLFCIIEVRDKETGEWIAREDVGVESTMEKEKGEASDAFKRASTNWGVGRELYRVPQIWVTIKKDEVNDKGKLYTKFFVDRIEYEGTTIVALEIIDQYGEVRFQWEKGMKAPQPRTQVDDLKAIKENALRMLKEAKVDEGWRKQVLGQFEGYDLPTLEKLIRAIPNKEKEFQKAELDRVAGEAFK